MFPARFEYEAPFSIEEACQILSSYGGNAKVLSGGQSLIPLLKLRFGAPACLVDINRIPGLDYHRMNADGSISIGALCRHGDLERSTILEANQPTLYALAPLIADPIVRQRGTLVGSLCHADPQGDWASAMMSLDGYLVVQGPNGRRNIKVSELVTGPFTNTLSFDEIAIEAVVPPPQGTPRGGYLKLERRVGDFATVGVAASVDTSGGTVNRAGIGLTGVGGTTINATAAASSLVGRPLNSSSISQAASLAAGASNPRGDHRGSSTWKRHIVETFVTRILEGVN